MRSGTVSLLRTRLMIQLRFAFVKTSATADLMISR